MVVPRPSGPADVCFHTAALSSQRGMFEMSVTYFQTSSTDRSIMIALLAPIATSTPRQAADPRHDRRRRHGPRRTGVPRVDTIVRAESTPAILAELTFVSSSQAARADRVSIG